MTDDVLWKMANYNEWWYLKEDVFIISHYLFMVKLVNKMKTIEDEKTELFKKNTMKLTI